MCAWEPFFRPCAKAMRNAHFPQCLRSALIPTLKYFVDPVISLSGKHAGDEILELFAPALPI